MLTQFILDSFLFWTFLSVIVITAIWIGRAAIRIFEYERHNQVVEQMNEPIGDSTYRFRYKRKCVVGEKHFYFCNGNQDCPKSV